jgi:tRNA nucleotidyltransferase/poly(A) polymerase
MSDYNFLMESKLSQEQYSVLSLISRLAYEQGSNLYLVGGAVRDLTIGQQVVRDLDFAVEGDPQKILHRLESQDSSPPVGVPARRGMGSQEPLSLEYQEFKAQSAAAELRFANGVRVELGQCHEDIFSKPGQPPEVRSAGIFEDLKRRDFSINAMAVSLHPNSRGLLLDPTNGAADIERRELRILYPRSFSDDPVRIYRLLRLGLRLDYTPEERTETCLEAALENHAWEHLGPDQQRRELRAILQEESPARILKLLGERKLLGGLDKKLATVPLNYQRFAKTRSAAQMVPGADPYLINFLCLVEKLGNAEKLRMAKKVLAVGKVIKQVLDTEHEAKKLARVLASPKAALPHQVYSLLSKQSRDLVLYLLVYYPQAQVQSRVKNYLNKYLPLRASLPRAELQALGFKPGPKFDQIIESVFLDQLDGKIKTHQQLTKALRERAGIKEPPEPPDLPHLPAPPTRRPRKPKEVPQARPMEPETAASSPNRFGNPPPPQNPPGVADKEKLPGKNLRGRRPALWRGHPARV